MIRNCQDNCPDVSLPPGLPPFAGPFARFEDNGGSPWIYSCSDNTCGSCYPYASAADFAAALSIENPFASCAADPVGITKRDPLNYCTATEELWCDWWTIEKGLDDEYKSSLYWEPSCSESSQINLCKPGSTCDSKEESDTPAENCLFNPTCFCLMDSLAGLPPGGGGSGPTCTPQY